MGNELASSTPVSLAETVPAIAWQIVEGLPPKYWEKLIEYSAIDDCINAFTSDPERFKDITAIKKWLQKGRDVYTITDLTGEMLLGLYWFGSEQIHADKQGEEFHFTEPINLDDYPITNARRVYSPLRGTGQSAAIFRQVFDRFSRTKTFKNTDGGIWTETSGNNQGVIKVDLNHGFRKVTDTNSRGKIILVADKAALLARIPVTPSGVHSRRSNDYK